jgi:hypothetical protein
VVWHLHLLRWHGRSVPPTKETTSDSIARPPKASTRAHRRSADRSFAMHAESCLQASASADSR